MSEKKGNFIIRNAAGTVVLAGSATFLNSNNSAGFTDLTALEVHKDSAGTPRVITRDYLEYQLDLDLTPGVGGTFASKAALQTAFAAVEKGSTITTSGFDLADLNWDSSKKGIVFDSSVSASNGQNATLKVQARRMATLDGTPIDFTGVWTTT